MLVYERLRRRQGGNDWICRQSGHLLRCRWRLKWMSRPRQRLLLRLRRRRGRRNPDNRHQGEVNVREYLATEPDNIEVSRL